MALQAYHTYRQQQEAQEAKWSDALKQISQDAKVSPILVILNPFLRSGRHVDDARKMAIQLAAGTSDLAFFKDILSNAFLPVTSSNLSDILEIDERVAIRYDLLTNKSWNERTQTFDIKGRLSTSEQLVYDYVQEALKTINADIASFLQAPRDGAKGPNLTGGFYFPCDWTGVNLSGSSIENSTFAFVILNGANLSGITSFEGAHFYNTAWWDASRLSPKLLEYLRQHYPFNPDPKENRYGNRGEPRSEADYNEAIARLAKAL